MLHVHIYSGPHSTPTHPQPPTDPSHTHHTHTPHTQTHRHPQTHTPTPTPTHTHNARKRKSTQVTVHACTHQDHTWTLITHLLYNLQSISHAHLTSPSKQHGCHGQLNVHEHSLTDTSPMPRCSTEWRVRILQHDRGGREHCGSSLLHF